jgi:hypothetical protein
MQKGAQSPIKNRKAPKMTTELVECSFCGKIHSQPVQNVKLENGIIERVPQTACRDIATDPPIDVTPKGNGTGNDTAK